jgi:hypothetical protein
MARDARAIRFEQSRHIALAHRADELRTARMKRATTWQAQ